MISSNKYVIFIYICISTCILGEYSVNIYRTYSCNNRLSKSNELSYFGAGQLLDEAYFQL